MVFIYGAPNARDTRQSQNFFNFGNFNFQINNSTSTTNCSLLRLAATSEQRGNPFVVIVALYFNLLADVAAEITCHA